MRTIRKARPLLAATAALLLTLATLGVASTATLNAQGNDAQVDLIECRTYIGADAPQPANHDTVLIQGQPVTVRCAYNVAPGSGSTLLAVNSELLTWKARISHYRNRKELDDGIATFGSMEVNASTLTPYQAKLENPEIIKIEVLGTTPTAVQQVAVDTGSDSMAAYHNVQKPNEFEALSISVEAAASKDRHAHRLTATTQRWQDTNDRLNRYVIENQRDGKPPPESVPVRRLLSEGYPNLADETLDEVSNLTGSEEGFLKQYKYYIIGAASIAILMASITIVVWKTMNKNDDGLDDL